ncbi:ArnT family glycosyltransferase [Leptospira noguchii]|uniref:Dolichyl-phosphate-mannose-protein mannosyltransferase n=1 Tax=Leptospira noguchii serovar Autumnalis str. ZUN142 TaxID=1085540 RepID=M6UGQ8_9LEPT|nr:glycosyltransferase family 39 protein [Leptospira noguchii]EMO40279.1 dolichyl-phosphate-mannose-protein mannosyltransferase [Leptospira noguchii serovar Autumnalis str. ZUN142]EMS83253.1 dolichyl-phosphate-mannose-protein mannosyltransferase [Leptospira noguchii str. Hook]UOG41896.1 glycosyltransferase family 39 protein [Leptospira noguchii]UOG49123.1 glycosyltransferase family 39 protein [Leptospira noguchii]
MGFMSRFLPAKTITWFILAILIFFFLWTSHNNRLEFPPVWPDEVLFFSPSQDFAEFGTFRTQVLEGLIPGMEKTTLWMPPLYFFSGGLWMKYVFPGIVGLRMYTLVVAAFCVFVFCGILLRIGFSSLSALFSCLLLVTDLLFLRVGTMARMEILCLFFALTSLFCIARTALDEISKPVGTIESLFSGIFLGLSFLSHPFGSVFGIPSLYLLWRRKSLSSILFWIGGMIPISIWIVWLLPHWDLFLFQFGLQFGRKKELFSVFSILTKIKILIGGYENPGVRILFYIFLLAGIGINQRLLNEKKEQFLFLLVWILGTVVFLFLATEFYYVMYLTLPLSALGGILLEESDRKRVIYTGSGLLFCNLIILFLAYRKIGFINPEFDLGKKFSQEIAAELKYSKKIYLQAIPDPYFYLKEKYPDQKILEFIPGELPVPSEMFVNTLDTIDTFVFSEGTKRNEGVENYLKENASSFYKRSVSVSPSTTRKLVRAQAEIYLRKKK